MPGSGGITDAGPPSGSRKSGASPRWRGRGSRSSRRAGRRRREVERAVAHRDLVEAIGREVLPQPIRRTVGGKVQAEAPAGPPRRLRGLGDERVAEVPRALADQPNHKQPRRGQRTTAARAAPPIRTASNAHPRPAASRPRPASSARKRVPRVKTRPGTRTPSQPGAKSYSSRYG